MQKRPKTTKKPSARSKARNQQRCRQQAARRPDQDSLEVVESQLALLVRTTAMLTPGPPTPRPLDRSSYLLLATLHENGPLTISTLADELCLAGSTVTRQVATMCAAGLVRSAADPADRRARVITMEPHGEELFQAERQQRRRVLLSITGSWSEDERCQLADLLAKLNRSLADLFDSAVLAPG